MKKYFFFATIVLLTLLAIHCKKEEDKPTPASTPEKPTTYTLSSDGKTLTKWGSTSTATVVDLTQDKTLSQITKIGDEAFKGQENITEITLPSTVNIIGSRAFYGCKNLSEITFTHKTSTSGRPAVQTDSISIDIPDSVKVIGQEAFAETRITYVRLPYGFKVISKGVFKGCTNLTTISYPETVEQIVDEAFYGCTNLTYSIVTNSRNEGRKRYFILAPKVNIIGARAFYGCENIKPLPAFKPEGSNIWENELFTIQAEKIGEEAFAYCKSLSAILFKSKELSKGVFKGCSRLSLVSLNSSITSIPDEAFYGTYLHESPIDESTPNIVSIGKSAFENAPMISAKFPLTLKTIGEKAFKGCPMDSDYFPFTLPSKLERIEKEAFAGGKFTAFTIPKSVAFIGEGAFNNCTALTKVRMESATPPVIEAGKSIINNGNTKICVPVTAENNYKTNESWKQYANRINAMGCGTAEEIIIRDGVLIHYPCHKIPAEGHLTLPNNITAIRYSAFSKCTNLKSIIIPNSVTKIGAGAFEGCTALSSVTIPNSVIEIEGVAFENCISLKSIHLPASIKILGQATFFKCSALTKVELESTIPPTLSNGENSVIFSRSAIKEIIVPRGSVNAYKTAIGWKEYASLIKAESDEKSENNSTNEIPEGVIVVNGVLAEWDCSKIPIDGKIVIPNSVNVISGGIFRGCKSLATVIIPNSVIKIHGEAFYECTSLKTITLPNSIKEIQAGAFEMCTSLESVKLSNSLTKIGFRCFNKCTSLKYINIPNSVTLLENSCFSGCKSLESIDIPDSVTEIGEFAFNECTSLKSISIPNSVKFLGGQCFQDCQSLKSVVLPNSITKIDNNAFYGCASLEAVNIPNSVTTLGEYSFLGCKSLTSIIIPNSVTQIGAQSFVNCNNLTSIILKATTPPTIKLPQYENNKDLFEYGKQNIKIYVPATAVEIYKNHKDWKPYARFIKAINSGS